MLSYKRLLSFLAIAYGAVFLIAVTFSDQKVYIDVDIGHNQQATFYMAQEVNKNPEDSEKNDFLAKLVESPETASGLRPRISINSMKYNPFALLGAYPDPTMYVGEAAYDKPHYGLINDDEYCNIVDLYNLQHPENMFENMNFFTDFSKGSIMKKDVMSKIGTLFLNDVERFMPDKLKFSRTYTIDKEITTFHLSTYTFQKFHEIGKHFLCATQMFNHIPNHTSLIQKDLFPENFRKYALQYQDRPQCFNKHSFYPQTYRLFVEEECQEFFKIINSKQYNESLKNEPIQYLKKIGHAAHKAEGVFLLDRNETKALNSQFDHGKKCGQVDNYLIMQKYIGNPLLLDNNNKFHMRVYVLIASTNPFIVFYHDGYIRASIFPFDKHSEDRATHLTNLLMGDQVAGALNKSNSTITAGKTAKELEDYYLWSFEQLESYLLESGKISDKNWLDNHLRPALQKAFVHVVRMTGGTFWKQSNVYQLLGCDFMIDENMGVWFLEANANPLLHGVKPGMIATMLEDLFEINYAYYRSRMARVLDVIQGMQKEAGNGSVRNLSKWRELYQQAVKNRLEPEYKIKKTNSFTKIMDESLPGAQAYFGHISEECVDY